MADPLTIFGVLEALGLVAGKETPSQRQARLYREQRARAEAERAKRAGQPQPPMSPKEIAQREWDAEARRAKLRAANEAKAIRDVEDALHALRTTQAERLRAFYNSRDWREARREAWLRLEHICVECGGREDNVGRMVVDHIRSARTHWHLRLDPGNFQILCWSCNVAKGSKADWRSDLYAK